MVVHCLDLTNEFTKESFLRSIIALNAAVRSGYELLVEAVSTRAGPRGWILNQG